MVANIYKSSFAGVTPGWHHIGVPLEEGATADRAMELAKQKDWGVQAVELEMDGVDGKGLHVLTRLDEGKVVVASETMVEKNYAPINNEEVFGPMVEMLAGENLKVDCAGVLGRLGNRAFMTFFAGDSIVTGGEGFQRYLVAVANHSGRDAVRFLPTGIRVVCENTEQAAFRSARAMLAIQHNKVALDRFYDDAGSARAIMGLTQHYEENLERMTRVMQEVPFNAIQWKNVIKLWEQKRKEPDTDRKRTYIETTTDRLFDAWALEVKRAEELEQNMVSLWTAKQAASTYTQHLARGGEKMRGRRSMKIAEGEDVEMMAELNRLIVHVARHTRHPSIKESHNEAALAWLGASR
jgi:phage/plasmid-like protein (TIGR03299 family)